MEYQITLPSKPRIVKEEGHSGVFEIDNLYPGYGHTLGNSLRRIILSSLPGAAITSVKIDGVAHEFATIEGVKEDVLGILLNLKKVHFDLATDEPQVVTLSGSGDLTAKDLKVPGQVTIVNPDQHIASTGKKKLELELTLEKGLGYIPKEALMKEKVDIGVIALDATFTPIRRVNYEVENMRVGDRTDFNRVRMFIETNGTISAKEALERAIEIMIHQLKAVIGFQEEEIEVPTVEEEAPAKEEATDAPEDVNKTRVETLDLGARVANALDEASIRTVGGLVKKSAKDLTELEGLGAKGVEEIEAALKKLGVALKEEE
ncbi:MAG: DNA-directed RNA polymerase subunit alpha [Patescibacteria group bacterium UBA2103]